MKTLYIVYQIMISAMKTGKGRESTRGWECRGIKCGGVQFNIGK